MAVQYHGLSERNFRYVPTLIERFNALADTYGTIHVTAAASYLTEVPEDEIAIVAYGNHTGNQAGMATHQLAGLGTFYDMWAYSTESDGEPFTLPGGRTNVGEVAPFRVYNYFGLYRDGVGSATPEMLDALINDPVSRCVDADFAAEAAAKLEAAARESIIALSRSTFQAGIDSRMARIVNNERELVQYGQSITNILTQLRRDKVELDLLMAQQSSDDSSRIADQYEMLKNHPRTTDVRFRGEEIIITTTPDLILHDYDADIERWLGAFKLQINIATQRVYITNLNTPRGGRQHPHVSGNDPCFGGHEMEFAQLMAEGQLLVLFELLLNYLETYNRNDAWGAYGRYWFDQDDQNPALQPSLDEQDAHDESVIASGVYAD